MLLIGHILTIKDFMEAMVMVVGDTEVMDVGVDMVDGAVGVGEYSILL
jgi:hypothetical protein